MRSCGEGEGEELGTLEEQWISMKGTEEEEHEPKRTKRETGEAG